MLDLFGGSGSTLIAAEQMGRHAFVMELDPLYCDVMVQRWQNFTGKKAQRPRQSRQPKKHRKGAYAALPKPRVFLWTYAW